MPRTRNHPASARAETGLRLAPTPAPAPVPWSVDVRLIWDAQLGYGWVSGSVWSNDGDSLLELPTIELEGLDLQADVVAMLRALYVDRADVSLGLGL
jgi:hypothetical protein